MAYSLAEIGDQALQLCPEDCACLALQLLASLEESGESAEEIENCGSPKLRSAFKSCKTVLYRESQLERCLPRYGQSFREGDDLPA